MKHILQHCESEASKSHLELDQLGRVLKAISNRLPGTTHAQHHALTVVYPVLSLFRCVVSAENI